MASKFAISLISGCRMVEVICFTPYSSDSRPTLLIHIRMNVIQYHAGDKALHVSSHGGEQPGACMVVAARPLYFCVALLCRKGAVCMTQLVSGLHNACSQVWCLNQVSSFTVSHLHHMLLTDSHDWTCRQGSGHVHISKRAPLPSSVPAAGHGLGANGCHARGRAAGCGAVSADAK